MLAYGDYLEIGFGVERDPAQGVHSFSGPTLFLHLNPLTTTDSSSCVLARMWWARAAENRNRTAANRLKYGYVAHSDEDW